MCVCVCVCVCVSVCVCVYCTYPDFFRFEHCVCLEPTFFFHMNASRDQVNP